MIEMFRRSLSKKTLLATALTMVVLLGLSSWINARDHRRTVVDLERSTSASFSAFVYNTLLLSMASGKMEDLQRILESAVGSAGIESLRLVSPDGEIKYSGRKDEIGTFLEDPRLLGLLQRGATASGLLDDLDLALGPAATSVMPLHNQQQCSPCHAGDGPYLGAVFMGFDVSGFTRRMASIRVRQALLLGISVVAVVAVVYLCLRLLVLRPLFRVVAGAQRMAQGDLSQPLEVVGEDEMARLGGHLNTLRAHLRDSFQESGLVAAALAQAVEELDRSSENLVTVAMEQSSGAAEQASAVQEATATAQQIAATSNEISANVESVERVAEDTFRASMHGQQAVTSAVEGMGLVREKVRAIADATVGLGKKSQKIGGVVDIIDEISEQTHLLALNAAIEAAGAGEHGKRFSVVAAEVRRLAERTVEATGQIKDLVEEIQESTGDTVRISEQGTAIAMEGADRVDKVGESLEGILALVRQTKESTQEITVATQQQASAGEQLVLTITDINDVAIQVNRSAEQVEKAVLRLKGLAQNLKALAEQNQITRKFTL